MKRNFKKWTLVIVIAIFILCLTSGSYAYYFKDQYSANYYKSKLMLDLRCNGALLDSSGQLNHGIVNGTSQYVTSVNDRGFNFNGSNYVTINDSASLDLGTGSFSIALWFKTGNYQLANVLIDKRDPNNNWRGYLVCLWGGYPLLQISDGTGYQNFCSYSGTTYLDNQWHYLGVSVSRDSSTVVTMYVDGVQVYQGSAGLIGSISNNMDLYLGKNRDNFGGVYFNGVLDDVSILNGNLDLPCFQNERQICRYNLYTSTGLDLTFDNTFEDDSRYQNITTNYGCGFVDSMNLTGINLNGSQYVQVNNSPSLNFGTGDFTIACWIKTNCTQIINTIMDKRIINTWQGYCLFLYNGKPYLQFGDETGPNNFWGNYNGAAINNDAWHFITVTVDRDQPTGLKMYVDGAQIYTDNPTVKPGNISNTEYLYIGKHIQGSYNNYHGALDEVYLINRALTPTEVSNFYQSNITPNLPPGDPEF